MGLLVTTTNTFIEHLLCGRPSAKCVMWITSFNPHNDPLRSILLIFHLIGRYRSIEILSYLLKSPSQRGTAGTGTSCLTPKPMLLTTVISYQSQ